MTTQSISTGKNSQQLFNEKPSYQYKQPQEPQEFPPTPTSSTVSFLAPREDSESIEEKFCSTKAYNSLSIRSYGALSLPLGPEYQNKSNNASSPASTISPNDDDEGLYLLWTHQLLKERGFKPASCRMNQVEEESDNDGVSIDSSITEDSVSTPYNRAFTPIYNSNDNIAASSNSYNQPFFSSFLSCFPKC